MPERVVEGAPVHDEFRLVPLAAVFIAISEDGLKLLERAVVVRPERVWRGWGLRKLVTIPSWERVDDYGPVVRISPGDSISFKATTEIGLTDEESSRIATGLGVSLPVLHASLQRTVSHVYGFKVTASVKQSISYERVFVNQDREGRDRILAFWRPALRLESHGLNGTFHQDLNLEQLRFLYETSEAAPLWTLRASASLYLSQHIEYPDAFA